MKRKREDDDIIHDMITEINIQKTILDDQLNNLKTEIVDCRTLKTEMTVKLGQMTRWLRESQKTANVLHKKSHLLLHKNTKLLAEKEKLEEDLCIEKTRSDNLERDVDCLEETQFELEESLLIRNEENASLREQQSELNIRLKEVNLLNIQKITDKASRFDKLENIIKTCLRPAKELQNWLVEAKIASGIETEMIEGVCVVCKCEKSTTAFTPCGHLCLCDDCSTDINKDNYNNSKCIYCNQTFLSLVKIYPS